jgi:ubiquinone/menaquinone biosynthesis C-methylase UbiE
MSGVTMLAHLIMERLSRRVLPRVPESEAVMQDPTRNCAYMQAGRADGILPFFHFFNALQITPVVRAGDRVLDLACGPGDQLAQNARLNPDARFVGLDASTDMLDKARATLAQHGAGNVELAAGDMTRLSGIDDASVDCVTCTMSLHHLPNLGALASTMRAVRRVLKPDGGFYIVDFGRLKRVSTQRFFAEERRTSQTVEFTQEYFDSLRAAFSVAELANAAALLDPRALRHATPLAPFLVVCKSANRRGLDAATRHMARETYRHLSAQQQRSFVVFARWFRAAGLGVPCKLT